MPNCSNCGAFVTDSYVRVFTPRDRETVRACPRCPDKVRDGGKVREARAPRGARAMGGEEA